MGTLSWIQKWYFEQCDGDWEHGYGIRIETIDNPGWSVIICVENTDVQDKLFEIVNIERHENDWVHCKIDYDKQRDGLQFYGYGGPENLGEILEIFKAWVER
jgi:hypothetical protein